MFEMLKSEVLKKYLNYINAIDNFSYKDLNSIDKRMELLKMYNEVVKSNAAYRNYINEHVRNLI